MNTIVANTKSQSDILDNLFSNVVLMSLEPDETNTVAHICEMVADMSVHNAEMYCSAGTDVGSPDNWKQFVANIHADKQWNDDVDWLSAIDCDVMTQYLLNRYNESKS